MKDKDKEAMMSELLTQQPSNSQLLLYSMKPNDKENYLKNIIYKMGLDNLFLDLGNKGLDNRYFTVGMKGKL
jgi:hypothetical protein